MSIEIPIVSNSHLVEELLSPYQSDLGGGYDAYRGHVYRVITYAMHFLRQDEKQRVLVETALVFHDIGLWAASELAYLEPSESIALKENKERALGLDPELLRAVIHWHHKITPYRGAGSTVVNAVRKADWIDASQGKIRKGLSVAQVQAVEKAIPNHGFPAVLQRLAKDIGGNAAVGNLRVLRHVFKV